MFLQICIYDKDFPVLCYNDDPEISSLCNKQIRIKNKQDRNDINKLTQTGNL